MSTTHQQSHIKFNNNNNVNNNNKSNATIQQSSLSPLHNHNWFKRYIIAAGASCTCEALTFPLDTIKTYRQLHSSQNLQHTIKLTNIKHLYDGLNAALARSLTYGGLGMLFYVPIRDVINNIDLNVTQHNHNHDTTHDNSNNNNNNQSGAKKLISGMLSGGLAQAIAQPTDVAKAIMQAHSRYIIIHNLHNIKKPTMVDVWRDIIKHEGLLGCWRGTVTSIQRASIINGTWAASYDTTKHYVKHKLISLHNDSNNNIQFNNATLQHYYNRITDQHDKAHIVTTYLIASQSAAFTSAIVAAPTDVIKTRMMTQALASKLPQHNNNNNNNKQQQSSHLSSIRYKSSFDCLVHTVRNEGTLALFKGAGSSVLRGSPWNFIYFIMFEELSQRLLGYSQI